MSSQKNRPSDERRAALKRDEMYKTPIISNITPIQRYYALSLRLLKSFHLAVEKNRLDEAYVYGLRFAKFSTEALPRHDYYKVNKKEYVQLRKDNENDLKLVVEKLEHVVDMMDLEELEKREIQRREMEALRLIQEREEQMKREEEERAKTQELLHRLKMLDSLGSVPSGVVVEKKQKAKLEKEKSVRENEVEESNVLLEGGDAFLPMPMPMPIPFAETKGSKLPPSYNDIANHSSRSLTDTADPTAPPSYEVLMQQKGKRSDFRQDSILNLRPSSSRSLHGGIGMGGAWEEGNQSHDKVFINPLQGPLGPLVPASLAEHGDVTNKFPPLPFDTQRQMAKSKFMKLRGEKMIDVFYLSTYQGRSKVKDSTNGCTVISPLVAVNHLNSDGSGISDMKIEQIIDEVAPNILSRVRNKLGLAPYALIIPSDVHDYLVDEKILKQEMFVGVCGGNILDSQHVCEFLNLLENGHESHPVDNVEEKKDMSRKVAAALFFHEHVVSILKVVLADGTTWYDLVDSLPNRRVVNGQEVIGATRTRCKDRLSLEALLLWYACDKFSAADAKYIDSNEWDDSMCDFDPRVFQGFVWKE